MHDMLAASAKSIWNLHRLSIGTGPRAPPLFVLTAEARLLFEPNCSLRTPAGAEDYPDPSGSWDER